MVKKIINDPRGVVDETLEGFLGPRNDYEKLEDAGNLREGQKG